MHAASDITTCYFVGQCDHFFCWSNSGNSGRTSAVEHITVVADLPHTPMYF